MKKLLLTITLLFICSCAYAQTYNIPDEPTPTVNMHRIRAVVFDNIDNRATVVIERGYDVAGDFVYASEFSITFEGSQWTQFINASKIDANGVKTAVKAKLGIQ